jgi:hypothetical protein
VAGYSGDYGCNARKDLLLIVIRNFAIRNELDDDAVRLMAAG